MAFSDRLDALIAPFAPGLAASRAEARNRLQVHRMAGEQIRQYDAATHGRRTSGWPRTASSGNAEIQRGGRTLAFAAHDLVRNNKYAASGVRQLVGMLWGDGIVPQFSHEDPFVAQLAQDEWDRWAESKVDGVGDWYGHGGLSTREMVVGGETLTLWGADKGEPDAQVMGLEGVQLDHTKTCPLENSARVVQGVELASGNRPRAYWLYPEHPHDVLLASSLVAKRIDGRHIDHLYERLRLGQARGVSWLGSVAMTMRDIGDIEDATRIREKVQACLALIITPKEGSEGSPLGAQEAPNPDNGDNLLESIRPGMIHRIRNGETVHTIDPQPSATTVNFVRQQLGAISANLVPYHVMTGDVSQANYSSLRAAMNAAYTNIDYWQQNIIIPQLARPAAMRRMRVAAMKTGDMRLLEVKTSYALPVRRMVDPVKDMAGEIMAIRAGIKTLKKALGERGENVADHLADIAEMNAKLDSLGLALDIDPRKLMNSGKLQDPVGYLGANGSEGDET